MVKHINPKKISRAARGKSTCHSFSGAKVKDVHQNFLESFKDEYDTVILHVGTNDLVNSDADEVATSMESLIAFVRNRAIKVGISSVIKWFDGKVPLSKIAYYNTLIYRLCAKHNVSYINNDDIGKNLLNGSNLHSNKFGDKSLGSAFCTFVKPVINSHDAATQSTTHQSFFQRPGRWSKEWTNYLRFVKRRLSK